MGERFIIEFFNREAPQLTNIAELLNTPKNHIELLIQAYNLLCDIIFDDVNGENYDGNDRATEPLLERPTLIIKTRERVHMIFSALESGTDEFCYTDLLMPEPGRTVAFLSQMIKFYNFKSFIARKTVQLDSDIDEQYKAFSFEKALKEKSDEQVRHQKEQLDELEARKHHLEEKELEMRHEVDAQIGQRNSKKKVCEALQERIKEMEAKIAGNRQNIKELEEAGKRLDMNIVNSPERIIGELEQLKLERNSVQLKLDDALQEHRKLEREMAEYTMAGQYLNGIGDEMQKLEAFQNRLLELRSLEDKSMQEQNRLELHKKSLFQELDHLQKNYESELNKLKQEIHASHKEVETIHQQKKRLEIDAEEMAVRLVNVKKDIHQHKQKIKRMERMFSTVQDTFDEAVENMHTNSTLLKEMVDKHQAKLNKYVK